MQVLPSGDEVHVYIIHRSSLAQIAGHMAEEPGSLQSLPLSPQLAAEFAALLGDTSRACALLNPGELARAARLRHPPSREQFILGRALLRTLAGRYLNRPPADLSFVVAEGGKPGLGPGEPSLEFNLSHSGDCFAFAFSARPVGVDVEQWETGRPLMELANRYFSAGESARIGTLSPELLETAFYRCWTSKEAWLKARGDGLRFPLDAFEVEVDPRQAPCLLSGLGVPESHAVATSAFVSLPVPAGYTATAVALFPEPQWSFQQYP